MSLAKELGFSGIVHKVLPNAGGIADEILVEDFQTVPHRCQKKLSDKGLHTVCWSGGCCS